MTDEPKLNRADRRRLARHERRMNAAIEWGQRNADLAGVRNPHTALNRVLEAVERGYGERSVEAGLVRLRFAKLRGMMKARAEHEAAVAAQPWNRVRAWVRALVASLFGAKVHLSMADLNEAAVPARGGQVGPQRSGRDGTQVGAGPQAIRR